MNILTYLWLNFVLLNIQIEPQPQDLGPAEEIEYDIVPSEVFLAKNSWVFIITKDKSICEYIDLLEYLCQCFAGRIPITKTKLPVGESRIMINTFFVNSDGFLVKPDMTFFMFLLKVQELEALYDLTLQLDYQYQVDNLLDVNLRWCRHVLDNALLICSFFIKEMNGNP